MKGATVLRMSRLNTLANHGLFAPIQVVDSLDSNSVVPSGAASFNRTHWSVVSAAADLVSPNAAAALETLCRTYWYPLYSYIRLRQFDLLKGFLSDLAVEGDYAAVAGTLGMDPGGVAVAVHRLRRRYRDIVRAEIGQTVTTESDLEAEMDHLFAALD